MPRMSPLARTAFAVALAMTYGVIGAVTASPDMWDAQEYSPAMTISVVAWLAAVLLGGWILGREIGASYGLLITVLQQVVFTLTGIPLDGEAIAWWTVSGIVGFIFGGITGALADAYRVSRVRMRELATKHAELQRATDALARSEAMFRQFGDRVNHGVWIDPTTARGGGSPYVNRAFRDLFEMGSGGPAEMDWMGKVHHDDHRRVEASVAALRRGEPQDIEFRIHRADGSMRWVRSQAFPVRGLADRIESYVGIVEDTTEVRERESRRELLERRERLSALGNLVAGVAHEVNNPLTYLMGNMQLAQAELARAAPDASRREGIERAQRLIRTSVEGGERIARIVRALRAVTRTTSEGAREPVRLNAVASSIHDLMRTSIPGAVSLELHVSPDDPEVDGNPGELAQVLLNLATNAVQAIGAGPGSVAIEVRCDETSATMSVRDDGPGLTPEAHARLFTPFFTTKAEGTGLGLSLAHAIVRDHGGEIHVENTPSEGAAFRVRLPLRALHPTKVIA